MTSRDLRREYAEHLVSEAAGGLRDAWWDQNAHAFLFYCYRQDSEISLDPICPDCSHTKHTGGVCGEPIPGSFPHLKACLCGDKGSQFPARFATIEKGALQYILDWVDSATDLLRGYRPKKESSKNQIKQLLSTENSVFFNKGSK